MITYILGAFGTLAGVFLFSLGVVIGLINWKERKTPYLGSSTFVWWIGVLTTAALLFAGGLFLVLGLCSTGVVAL